MLQVTASDSDDPTYGNSARIVYSILQGQPYFSIDPKTGAVSLHAAATISQTQELSIKAGVISPTRLHC